MKVHGAFGCRIPDGRHKITEQQNINFEYPRFRPVCEQAVEAEDGAVKGWGYITGQALKSVSRFHLSSKGL